MGNITNALWQRIHTKISRFAPTAPNIALFVMLGVLFNHQISKGRAMRNPLSELVSLTNMEIEKFISEKVPPGSNTEKAIGEMQLLGFKCKVMLNTRFASDDPAGGQQLLHGPSDTLWCDSGEVSVPFQVFPVRVQVTFVLSERNKVSSIYVARGITGL